MVNDNLKLTGALTIALNNEVVHEVKNLVVTAGKNYVASRMKDTTKTALVAENDRNTLTSTTVTSNAVIYVCTWAAGDGTAALTEAAIFNASSGGDMLARTVFTVVNKAAADSMTITWTVTVS